LPRFHALIEEICLLELELDCCFQVIHVPGVVVIDQDTDGLSREIWASPFHGLTDSLVLTRAVFEPLAFDSALMDRCVCDHQLPRIWRHQDWDQVWGSNENLDVHHWKSGVSGRSPWLPFSSFLPLFRLFGGVSLGTQLNW
jgi:hypothetical protein